MTICFAVTLYFGHVDASALSVSVSHACRKMPAATAKVVTEACASEDATQCEVITDPKGKVTIEHKLLTGEKR